MAFRSLVLLKPFTFYILVAVNLSVALYLIVRDSNQVSYPSQQQAFANDLQKRSSIDYLERVRNLTQCKDKQNEFKRFLQNKFQALGNYFKPAGVAPRCHETVTYTTHGDFTFLNNIVQLLLRWLAPISIAVYCPGSDYELALESVLYLRNCISQSILIRQFVTFHFYFDQNHTPQNLNYDTDDLERNFNCNKEPPYKLIEPKNTYKSKINLTYYVNVGRNIARSTATTHFIFASDIELYPSSGLPHQFLEMYARLGSSNDKKEVFVLPIFEIQHKEVVPLDKTKLVMMINEEVVIPFHYKICSYCHLVPGYDKWLRQPQTSQLDIFTTAKRLGGFKIWEPIYISSNQVPLYEEKLNWEGKYDKMTQAFIMCIQDYDFHVLNNAFLVHRPGFKTEATAIRPEYEKINQDIIKNEVLPQILSIYGYREGCYCTEPTEDLLPSRFLSKIFRKLNKFT